MEAPTFGNQSSLKWWYGPGALPQMQEIQFLESMGGSNLTHAHSNDLLCMRFK